MLSLHRATIKILIVKCVKYYHIVPISKHINKYRDIKCCPYCAALVCICSTVACLYNAERTELARPCLEYHCDLSRLEQYWQLHQMLTKAKSHELGIPGRKERKKKGRISLRQCLGSHLCPVEVLCAVRYSIPLWVRDSPFCPIVDPLRGKNTTKKTKLKEKMVCVLHGCSLFMLLCQCTMQLMRMIQ